MPKTVELKRNLMTKTFDSYPTFSEVESVPLKTWNRCATFFNIGKDINLKESVEYAKQFSVEDRKLMQSMFEFIEENGYDYTKTLITKGIYAQ